MKVLKITINELSKEKVKELCEEMNDYEYSILGHPTLTYYLENKSYLFITENEKHLEDVINTLDNLLQNYEIESIFPEEDLNIN